MDAKSHFRILANQQIGIEASGHEKSCRADEDVATERRDLARGCVPLEIAEPCEDRCVWKTLTPSSAHRADLRRPCQFRLGLTQPPVHQLAIAINELHRFQVWTPTEQMLESRIASTGHAMLIGTKFDDLRAQRARQLRASIH